MALHRIPINTYRLQLSSKFNFEAARLMIPYFEELGITDLYLSPVLQARHGSSHGYDVTDPTRLNSDLGSTDEFEALTREIQEHHMGVLLDIVPNHMAASSENPWWMGVLENGSSSAYAPYFDIDWRPPRRRLEGKVLLPVLGRPYAQVLESRELKLVYERDGFFIEYFDTKLPVAPKSYERILHHQLDALEGALGASDPDWRELTGILAAIGNLHGRTGSEAEAPGERRLQREAIKERLWALYSSSNPVQKFLSENLDRFNGERSHPASFLLMDVLLAEQAYFLTYWRAPNAEINYRRFFTISDLVGVRVEDSLVFEATHGVILSLIERGMVTGLRVDHIDGLRDPWGYLHRLQERVSQAFSENKSSDGFYIVVEKILSGQETLPEDWPAAGTTGYDFLNVLNGIFMNPRGSAALDRIYARFLKEKLRYADLVYQKKKEIMETLLAAEMRALGHYLGLLAEQDRYAREISRQELERALIETTACFPVYRTYVRCFEIPLPQRETIEGAILHARQRHPGLSSALEFIRQVLVLEEGGHVSPEQREAWLAFVMRWQQYTGPITAKAIEDSALYIYNRLISLNEVGGDPCSRGTSIQSFHSFNLDRRARWPSTLNATSTHDAKRSEDVRARINVLSEMPDKWEDCLTRWSQWNAAKKQLVDGLLVPVPNEEFHLYQTMLGAWPLHDPEPISFRTRLKDYMVKATREARVYTKWTLPNAPHEQALADFIDALFEDFRSDGFLQDFIRFQKQVAFYGALNSLAQVLLKIAAPGVPDFYQGSELWDLRLVDPDNRCPVDFVLRRELLKQIEERASCLKSLNEDLLKNWEDGRVKLFLMCRGLKFRRDHAGLFAEGEYLPLAARGSRKQNVCSFARRKEKGWAIVAVPRLVAAFSPPFVFPLGRPAWGDSALYFPNQGPEEWFNIFTGETLHASPCKTEKKCLALADLFASFPFALLIPA